MPEMDTDASTTWGAVTGGDGEEIIDRSGGCG